MALHKRQKNAVSFERTVVVGLLTAGFFAFLASRPFGEQVENVLARPLEFQLRRWLKKDPAIDPRVQIYVVEDSTVEYLKKENLSLDDWAGVVSGFKAANPRVVLIDKVFGIPQSDADANAFVTKIKTLPYPVIAGGFVTASAIKNRPIVPAYDFTQKITEGSSKILSNSDEIDSLPIVPGYPYGPAENIRSAFRYVGHIMYASDSYYQPMARISRYQGLPGAPLFTAKDIHFSDGKLVVDGSSIPIDRSGKILINFVSPSLFYDRTERMSILLELIKNKKPFPKIPEDSVVVLLPQQYTGNTDYKLTPFGNLPGGYVISSLVNSVVSGQWIRTLPGGWLVTLGAGLSSVVLVTWMGGVTFWITVACGSIGLVIFGLLTFSFGGLAFPWLFSSLSFFTSSFAVFALNAREMMRRRMEGVAGTATPLEVKYDERTGQPTRMGRYHVIERIGKGGMGEVYRAKIFGAGGFEKEFAIKRVAPEYWTDKTVIQSFLDEARLTSYLTHLNIVQVFEFLKLEDSYLLVMEYVRGRNLADILKTVKQGKRKFPVELGVYVASEVCKALEYAHSKVDPKTGSPMKIIHRDISPQNILLAEDGTVKVIDFGIAKGIFSTEHTKTGMVKGKLAYMSPEQAAARPLDRRSDLFSVALVLYELVSGQRAVTADSEMQTLKRVKEWRTDSLPLQDLDIPGSLKKVIERGLEREPEKRYQKADEMYRDLADFLSQIHFGIGQKIQAEFLNSLNDMETKSENVSNTSSTKNTEQTIVSQVQEAEKKTGTYQ